MRIGSVIIENIQIVTPKSDSTAIETTYSTCLAMGGLFGGSERLIRERQSILG
jgi:hypothetical protein